MQISSASFWRGLYFLRTQAPYMPCMSMRRRDLGSSPRRVDPSLFPLTCACRRISMNAGTFLAGQSLSQHSRSGGSSAAAAAAVATAAAATAAAATAAAVAAAAAAAPAERQQPVRVAARAPPSLSCACPTCACPALCASVRVRRSGQCAMHYDASCLMVGVARSDRESDRCGCGDKMCDVWCKGQNFPRLRWAP